MSDSVAEEPNDSTAQSDDSLLAAEQKNKKIEFAIEWAIKVLGLTAAILFGIWAPLSYKAAAEGKDSNDAGQRSVMLAMSTANAQAASAMDFQWSALSVQQSAAAAQSTVLEAQASVLDDIQRRLVAMGQLSLVEFCLRQDAYAPCESFMSNAQVTSLVRYLATTARTTADMTTMTSERTTRASPTGGSTMAPTRSALASTESNSGGAQLSLAGILGIVSAVLVCLGAALGVVVWKQRVRRHVRWRVLRN
ncbi:hypothetical protein H2201_006115 [Coniosporium apollinis]|uniref:Polysaccharide chain length determinant N-terminal domain-containing protein n=1 Tax=Coniosporium apollinis TaxID=61459 RepID=A0ABQ9NNR0_9PEZI|nr:hypothetical protein H2201_006115 [Coniosporium apollinis]